MKPLQNETFNMILTVTQSENDSFTVRVDDNSREGHFEIENGRAKALVLELEAGTVRLERGSPGS